MSQDARKDEEQSTQRRARILGFNYYDTSLPNAIQLFKGLLTNEEMYQQRVVPLQVNEGSIVFGITTTTAQPVLTKLQQQFADQRTSYQLISDVGFRDFMKLYDPPKQVVYQDITVGRGDEKALLAQVSEVLSQVKADDMLAYLTQQAHKLAASDIHIENQRGAVRIRFRIDGVLHPVAQITPDRGRMLMSAVASAGNVSTAADEAQQGHISQHVVMADGEQVDVNLRVETVPAINGMDVVMRLFNMKAEMYTLERLGLSPPERAVLEGIIKKPSGLVLAVGPTGSGKTTTLYSILNTLNTDERKIITIEDPVEYQFEGITQVSVKTQKESTANFDSKLRAVLRLDPDIVMVGEIRDGETAKTALQASLTGHLVLSTFHAGSAAAALTRLLNIIGENPLFISAIRLIMAQRLVRKLDDKTKVAYTPEPAVTAQLQKIIDSFPPGVARPPLQGVQLYRAGKSDDNPFGYEGQIALREQMVMSDQLRSLLQQKSTMLSTQEIESMAVQSGMLTMLQSAVLHLLAGQTTVDEVTRVLG